MTADQLSDQLSVKDTTSTRSPTRRTGTPPPARHGELTPRSAWWFFAATFILSWGLGALVVTFMDQVEAWFGPMGYTNPAFILMVYSPGFIGVYMVWRHYGVAGLKLFFGRLTLWRMSV